MAMTFGQQMTCVFFSGHTLTVDCMTILLAQWSINDSHDGPNLVAISFPGPLFEYIG